MSGFIENITSILAKETQLQKVKLNEEGGVHFFYDVDYEVSVRMKRVLADASMRYAFKTILDIATVTIRPPNEE